jgi:hypothetical protein
MKRTIALAVALLLYAVVNTCHAQWVGGWGGGWGNNGASTVGQSYAMGMADLVQSAGQANLSNSEAAKNWEQASSMNLDNQLKNTKTFFEMRKMNTAYRQAEDARFKGLTTEDSWRVAQMYTPKRLRSTQLDPVTGKIYWPIMFQNPAYDQYRQELEKLFVERESAHGSIGYENYMQIQKITDAMMATLKKNIDQYRPGDYLAMKSFVESLAYEASLPAA